MSDVEEIMIYRMKIHELEEDKAVLIDTLETIDVMLNEKTKLSFAEVIGLQSVVKYVLDRVKR
jgi:hypothetical protein